MLNKITKLASTALLSLAFSSSVMAADTYTLDGTHTAVTWEIDHFGFSKPSGKFMNFEGTLVLDEKDPSKSSVKVTIPVADINTGVAKLDEHLKGKDFFDVATYPTATFVSTSVKPTDKDKAKVTGDLTIHGVTKSVVLDVELNKIGDNIKKVKTAGFSASTKIKRSDFGISAYLPGLGDEVEIEIESEANLVTGEAAPAEKK